MANVLWVKLPPVENHWIRLIQALASLGREAGHQGCLSVSQAFPSPRRTPAGKETIRRDMEVKQEGEETDLQKHSSVLNSSANIHNLTRELIFTL